MQPAQREAAVAGLALPATAAPSGVEAGDLPEVCDRTDGPAPAWACAGQLLGAGWPESRGVTIDLVVMRQNQGPLADGACRGRESRCRAVE
eukprot:scaffold59240_cov66-Phaeocystis_antarctica.AAC.6